MHSSIIKRGWLANPSFIDRFPIYKPWQIVVDVQLPGLKPMEGNNSF